MPRRGARIYDAEMMPSALDLVRRYASGETTAAETVRDVLDRLADLRETVGGVAATDPERSLAEAAEADRRLRAGEGGPLEGVPVTVKDWIDVAGLPVTGATGSHVGSPGRRPGADATAVARLRAAGAIVVAISSAMADNPCTAVRGTRSTRRAPPAARRRERRRWWARERCRSDWAATRAAAYGCRRRGAASRD
nr:hypothetical protein GCM10020093_008240 [Planobispora longispora]